MSHNHCVTLAAVGGLLSGAFAMWSGERLYWHLKWRYGKCICDDGRVRVGSVNVWRWEPCPFCGRGNDRLRAAPPEDTKP